jgi:rhomboid family GlyGly-CTERM serine protease
LLIAAAALVVAMSPPAVAEALQLDRARVLGGEWYRLLTCHVAHFTRSHLAWDLAMFAALGAVAGMRECARTLAALLPAAIAIPLGVLLFQPSLQTYRGLSGLDSALFVLIVGRQVMSDDDARWLPLACLVAFAAKVTYECATGHTLFVTGSSEFTAVPLAHAIGSICGAAVACWPSAQARMTSENPGGSWHRAGAGWAGLRHL